MPVAPGTPTGSARDRYSTLFEEWARRDANSRLRLDPGLVREELEASFAARGSRRAPVDVAMLELFAACRADARAGRSHALEPLAQAALVDRLGGRAGAGFEDFVRTDVLAGQSTRSSLARAGACALLGTQRRPGVLDVLVAGVQDTHAEVRLEARRALIGAGDVRASRALLEACEASTGREGALARDDLAAHLAVLSTVGAAAAAAWPSDLAARLPRAALPALVDSDWRAASRGVALARHCDFEQTAPRCIEALHTWARREAAATDTRALVGTRRVMHEIAGVLADGSGLQLGIDAERWRQWWRARRDGAPQAPTGTRSVAPGFFGLDVRSGAVAFVLDASGSMDYPMPLQTTRASERSRFEEALVQLDRVLASLDPPAVFQVVLFDDEARRFADEAQPLDERSRSRVAAWLARNGPRGGTRLGAGLAELLPEGGGLPDVDTVVVLCDGDTSEDARWVRDWLAEHNGEARLVFHCVQLGGGSGAALRALAEGSGGRFLASGDGR